MQCILRALLSLLLLFFVHLPLFFFSSFCAFEFFFFLRPVQLFQPLRACCLLWDFQLLNRSFEGASLFFFFFSFIFLTCFFFSLLHTLLSVFICPPPPHVSPLVHLCHQYGYFTCLYVAIVFFFFLFPFLF